MTESCNKNIILTRSIYLRSVALIYLFAFLSLFSQLQGLWGDEGILPAKILLQKLREAYKENFTFFNMPTLFWFSDIIQDLLLIAFPQLSISSSVENSMYVLCLSGILISLSIVVNWGIFYNAIGFALIWFIYLSFFLIGQVFMSYQWDIFLLEVGFITILFAPLTKKRLSYISPIDNTVYFLIRYLMFRFIYSNGIVKVTANCPTWKTFTTLSHHFQSQPIPSYFSWFAHFMPDSVLKVITALTFYIEIYAPFLFFSFFVRRLNIFAGILQVCLQVGIMITGNYNFFNLLTIVVNLSNFDDEFLRAIIPEKILKLLDIDPIDNDSLVEIEEEDDLTEEASEDEKIQKILKNKKLRRIDEETGTSIIAEILIFINMLSVTLLIVFFYIYPLKDLLPGNITITPKSLGKFYNNEYMNYYILIIFCYILIKLAISQLSSLNKDLNDTISNSIGKTILKQVFVLLTSIKVLPFLIFIFLYFFHATNVFYKSIDFKVPTKTFVGKYFDEAEKFTDAIFVRFRISHGYGLFRVMTGVGYRPELEVKYQIGNDWETLHFAYKMSDEKGLRFNFPHQPRLDWQIWFSALANNMNTEGWLAVTCGKVLERNPVILDMLGYHVDEKESYYRCKYKLILDSLWENIQRFIYGDRPVMKGVPNKIKVDSYKYYFNNWSEYSKTKKFWRKNHVKEFLQPVDKKVLSQVLRQFDLPPIDEKRYIHINKFQNIPVIDICLIVILMKLVRRLF